MKKLFFSFLLLLPFVASTSVYAEDIPNNEIWYEASSKLKITQNEGDPIGVYYDAFNTTIASLSFDNGKGIIKFNYDVTYIGASAFLYCSSLTSITIPNSVTRIGNDAFRGCSSLTSVTIPNKVTSIESSLFENCSSLASIIIPDSVTSIGSSAFSGCSRLASITIPNSVTSIRYFAFEGCSSLKDVQVFWDKPISISENVFEGISSSAVLTVPAGTENKYRNATGWKKFVNIKGILTNISFNSTTYNLVEGETKQLDPITTPSGISYDLLNWSSSNPTVATVSSKGLVTAKTVGTTTIKCSYGSVNASCKIVVNNAPKSISFDPNRYILSKDASQQLEPILVPSDFAQNLLSWTSSNPSVVTVSATGVITAKSEGMVTIECSAGSVKASCQVFVPSANVIYVGGVFYKLCNDDGGYYEVTNFINKEDSTLTENSFYSGTVNIPAQLSYGGETKPVQRIGKFAFAKQTELQSVVLQEKITEIAEGAFYRCNNLARVLFMNSTKNLQTIGVDAFNQCTKLATMTLPTTVTTISKRAFWGCTALASINLSSSLNYIDEYAFAKCTALKKIEFPSKVGSVQNYAFQGDTSLEEVIIPAGLQGIGNSCFSDCKALKTVTFNTNHSSLTMGTNAFLNCTKLSKVNIANLDSWVYINFNNAEANPTTYAHHIYQNGKEVRDVSLPETTMYINSHAFTNCTSIYTLRMPASVQYVNDNIFYGCTALTRVYCNASYPPAFIGTDDPSKMSNVFNATTLFVPASSIADYKADSWWKRFKSIVDIATDIQEVESSTQEEQSIFNMGGQKLSMPQKGINIINGKKVLF